MMRSFAPLRMTEGDCFCRLRNIRNNGRGFTLAEVLISMTVLSLTFAAAVGLLLSSIQANRANKNDFIAYGLAQEGLEAVRNIRDSNWMQNFPWTGTKDDRWKDAGGYFGDIIDLEETHYYSVSYNSDYEASASESTASKYNPWILEELGTEFDDIASSDFALHADDLGPDIFSRYIEIQPVFLSDGKVDLNRAKVFSVVFWNEKGRGRNITLDTILTNWRGGAL